MIGIPGLTAREYIDTLSRSDEFLQTLQAYGREGVFGHFSGTDFPAAPEHIDSRSFDFTGAPTEVAVLFFRSTNRNLLRVITLGMGYCVPDGSPFRYEYQVDFPGDPRFVYSEMADDLLQACRMCFGLGDAVTEDEVAEGVQLRLFQAMPHTIAKHTGVAFFLDEHLGMEEIRLMRLLPVCPAEMLLMQERGLDELLALAAERQVDFSSPDRDAVL